MIKIFVVDDEGQTCSALFLHHWINLQLTNTELVVPGLLIFASKVHRKQTFPITEWMAEELRNGTILCPYEERGP